MDVLASVRAIAITIAIALAAGCAHPMQWHHHGQRRQADALAHQPVQLAQ